MINKLDICVQLIGNYEKCVKLISYYDLSFFLQKIKSFDLIFIFIFFFTLTYIFTRNIKNKYVIFKNCLLGLNFFLLFSSLYFFPVNLPFGDVWEEYQMISTNNTLDYLFSVNWSGHNFLTTRIIFYLINEYLNFNLVYIHIISLFLYSLSIFIFFKFLNKNKSKYFIVLLPLLFSGKWFNHVFETINFVWVLNFFLIILIIYYLNLKENFKLFQISLILLVLLLSFAGGYFVFIYLIFYLICNEKINIKNKLIIFFIFIGTLLLTNLIIPAFNNTNPYLMPDYLDYMSAFKISQIFISFLGMISSIYLPFIFYKIDIFKYLIVLFGFIQLTVLFIIFINSKINFKKFIIENPFLIIGIISCLIISIVRPDRFGETRYATYSIIFQLGFFIFALTSKNLVYFFDKFYKSIFIILIFLYSINLISPHTGIFFSSSRYIVKDKIDECLTNKNLYQCENLIYDKLFFNGDWFDKNNFSILLNKINNEKKSFFYDLK